MLMPRDCHTGGVAGTTVTSRQKILNESATSLLSKMLLHKEPSQRGSNKKQQARPIRGKKKRNQAKYAEGSKKLRSPGIQTLPVLRRLDPRADYLHKAACGCGMRPGGDALALCPAPSSPALAPAPLCARAHPLAPLGGALAPHRAPVPWAMRPLLALGPNGAKLVAPYSFLSSEVNENSS